MKKYFPIFVDLEKKDILVVGGGKIAYRKVKTLLSYGARIEVITPEIRDEKFYELVEEKSIKLTPRKFRNSDIHGRFLVVGATDNKELNKEIYELGDSENTLVNNITTKEDLNARFCAVHRGEDFQVAISTDEGNPKRALELKKAVEEKINSN
ncbi:MULTISPECIES: precorrin-2 dehydrogenase/sirohydrochlorin ferrochelatase family protein [Psychrilyobacter]|uniref:precorrin-2 dehydrogenase n=1 Tax=Psychrilyobacter piezotolerans TaxID=2293438 RepID=A0ABX9KIE8_9FUSO|nr:MULTISPECIES: bifunctional precorrin-2 dehydrogenase/sirohydrochlorin ferrochelatase [Psychrilyobacter]MCS5421667.1 bifunctional precorrin-2 dehydrogenase/sirohydrochlorin ferrochelatase [Psychrilyobacter sp. S5]NDI77235.1 bifunctional precorrin-2 dehydrogenase/sirohydrochlorin ferrochelatase [Psychrilyobacter piezotolerans]RDE63293.1 bifunctional precorrin-2 dehydrogenase/sirohydrochlorin ferrochelatase [Psychrilyobacter sp. S5]REI41835.1 bifunctional precorrin-2 dehydrogenase/sirohydrochlo